LDKASRDLIERSDTLFVATFYSDGRDVSSRGADVSHRGGKPGFVRVEDDRTLIFPDFAGNYHFNTVGNIALNPKAGFLFVDFESGDLVYLTGHAEIVWEGEMVRAFAGAERMIRFHLDDLIRVEASLPLEFAFGEYSPLLDHTGSWEQADATIAANRERNAYAAYEIVDIRPESEVIASFHLRRADGKGLPLYEPGQFLPLRLTLPGHAEPVVRTYTLSDAPGGDTYRLSIKREGGGALVSNAFHDHMGVGARVEAMAPRGKFILDRSSRRPVVLLSAGVGITPMIAMANFIIDEGVRTRRFRRTTFIHGARNGRVHAFREHIRRLAAEHEAFTAHVRYSHPDATDRLGETHQSEGHVDVALLKEILPFDDYDFYLCGPPPFMRSLFEGLTALGVRENRIRYESFGPATVLKSGASGDKARSSSVSSKAPVAVHFATSDVDAEWSPDKGTLLDLAEAAGLVPAYACRSGICGTCATRIRCGAVDYLEDPSAPRAGDEVLICCSTPRSDAGEATCGNDNGVVLEL
jgi:ferredoxin-NADP reductase